MNLESFLRDIQVNREIHQFPEKSIMDGASTKEKRQVLLDSFFRVVCLQVISVLQSGVLKQKTHVFVPRRHRSKCLQIENTFIYAQERYVKMSSNRNTCIYAQERYVKMSSNRKHMYLCLGDICQNVFKQKTHVFVPRRHSSKCLLIENTCIWAQETQIKLVSSFIVMV